MKIAATYEDGNVFQHFGHTENFKIYEIENRQIVSSEVVPTDGFGHGALAGFLANKGVSVLICGGLGYGAKMALAESGILVCAGISGDCDSAVKALLEGTLNINSEANCDHHHENGGGCHEGGCHEGGGCHENGGCHGGCQ